MKLTAQIAEAIGVAADADQAAVLAALDIKVEVPAETPEVKSLDEQAKEEGKIVVSAEQLTELTTKANAGEKASKDLSLMKFTTAFDKALEDLKVDAKDETRERFTKLYELAPEQTLETLENLQPIANAKPKGSNEGATETPDGVDPDRHAIDLKVKARMAEHKETYDVALEAVVSEMEEAS